MSASRSSSCSSFRPAPVNRRDWLQQSASGFGSVALAGLLANPGQALAASSVKLPQMRPRAKNVIFLYMDGGPSQVDTFDPKPLLTFFEAQTAAGGGGLARVSASIRAATRPPQHWPRIGPSG